MAVSLLSHEVCDLCIGKPVLKTLAANATVGNALAALKRSGERYISVWSCSDSDDHHHHHVGCVCLGKVCVGDIVCFLSKQENLSNPAKALLSSVSSLLPKTPALVKHLEPNASLSEAIDLMLGGAQNLVIPIENPNRNLRRKLLQKPSLGRILHNNRQYCWLTQEDIIRYLLNSICVFSPTPSQPINTLEIIEMDNNVLAVHYDDPASAALPSVVESLVKQTSVAIVDDNGKLIGEISPCMINSCDETVAAAIATLSAGDLMAYIDCGGPPEELVWLVKERLEERNLGAFLELMDEDLSLSSSSCSSSSYSSSSDEEGSVGRNRRQRGYSARGVRRSEAIVCYPWSSLVAVMIQALSRRASYIWVVEDDGTLTGIVTLTGMLKVLREQLQSVV